MSDLIRRQEVLSLIENTPYDWSNITERTVMLWKIRALPSEGRVSGKWWIREYEYFTCSECGDDYWNGCDCTEEAEERLRNGDYPNFCPNCGAKMIRENGEEE